MKYKGYELTRYNSPGSDFNVKEDGTISSRRPKLADLDHVGTVHIETGEQLPNSLSFEEARKFIKMYSELK
tara:strand:- start:89 stop:301 length:213 start_codon:yes stop_codon:yes gene_type:complete